MSRFLLSLPLLALLAACSADPAPERVQSHLAGSIALADSAVGVEVERFSVLVFNETPSGADTLARARVQPDGTFATDVVADERGVYPLVLLYDDQPLRLDELVVAAGDSATVRFAFPVTSRLLRIRSRENDAWTAYRNARALLDQATRESVGQDDALARIGQATRQTSSILWSLRESFPGTVAEALGAAESIVLLDGWDDSLLVVRAREIEPSNPGFVTVAQAARRGMARREGQGAAIKLLKEFQARAADADDRAALQAEVVTARLDSLQAEAAIAEAEALRAQHPRSEWAAWAERAAYEAETLLPGKKAPTFDVRDDRGRRVRLDSLRGRYVVLEFFTPGNEAFSQQLDGRLALEEALAEYPLTFVSVSVDRDSLLSRAFFSQVPLQGRRIVASEGYEAPLAVQYNVHVLPTRYLIDPEGTVLAKYVGPLVPQLTQDLLTVFGFAPDA